MINKVIKKNKSYDCVWANDLPTLYPAFKISNILNSRLIYDSHEIFHRNIKPIFSRKE